VWGGGGGGGGVGVASHLLGALIPHQIFVYCSQKRSWMFPWGPKLLDMVPRSVFFTTQSLREPKKRAQIAP
jgi:hypothetical protein